MKVTLKDGTDVEIGEISWGGWTYLKQQAQELLADEATQEILSVILGDIQTEDEQFDYKTLAPAIPRLIGLLMRTLDSCTLYLADECCETQLETPLERRGLKFTDVNNLREAILKENDFVGYIKQEGNSFLAAIPESHRGTIEKIFSDLAGTFSGNQSSPEATAGPPMSSAS